MAKQRDPSDFEEEQKLYPEDYEELNDMLEFWASRASKATGVAYITWKDAKRFLPNLSDELLRDILQWYSKGQKVISTTYNRCIGVDCAYDCSSGSCHDFRWSSIVIDSQ
jgi:hypothetical protein